MQLRYGVILGDETGGGQNLLIDGYQKENREVEKLEAENGCNRVEGIDHKNTGIWKLRTNVLTDSLV